MRKGVRLKMHGKVYQVLLALIEKQGQIVTREEIKQALWPGNTYVNYDANVNTTLNKLRQVLGDSSDQPIYIETIPRKGYVFLGQAEYSTAPFPLAPEGEEPGDPAARGKASGAESGAPAEVSSRWLTLGIIVLILAGILLGAGIATLWMSHVSGGGKFF
jgi:DNA-binding winged helix-turn-helix (wHTH) protein